MCWAVMSPDAGRASAPQAVGSSPESTERGRRKHESGAAEVIPILRTSLTHLFYLSHSELRGEDLCTMRRVYTRAQPVSSGSQCRYKAFSHPKNQQLPSSIRLLLNSSNNISVKAVNGQQRNVTQSNKCTWKQWACLSPHLALNQIS